MMIVEAIEPAFYPEISESLSDNQMASSGVMVMFGGGVFGSAVILLPALVATGHFDSPRPSYNEFIPTVDQICTMFLQLMPRGRAYGTHDLTIPKEINPIKQFWCAVAVEWAVFENLAVRLLDEAFCTFTSEDLDGWKSDYILPDEAAVYGDNVCAKSNRIGAISIDEYRRIAESLGWVLLDIRFLKGDDEEFPGVFATLYVKASITSPIVPNVTLLGEDFVLGSSQLGDIGVPEAVAHLEGLYDRSLPAHVDLMVEVV